MPRSHHHPRGFSFAEVMFSVVILGIGFILVAAIFPVAIQQTQNTSDEATAARLARTAVDTVVAATKAGDFPDADGTTQSFADVTPLWNAVSGNFVDVTDSRYAWVPYFTRIGDGTIRLTILVVRRVNPGFYSPADTNPATGPLVPRGVKVVGITRESDGTDTAEITRDAAGSYAAIDAGTFLVIRSGDGNFAGRAFRVGQLRSESADSVKWTLMPGNGLAAGETCGAASAAVIGRDFADPADPSKGFAGPSQDVALYTTFIKS